MDLFLVAVVLPEPVRAAVWELKQEMHRRTGSRNAVSLPPHITLVPPLRQPPEFEAAAQVALATFAAEQPPCPLELQGFRWFQQRTLYVALANDAAVQQLHAALYQWCGRHLPYVPPPRRPFVPHVTLATRDLPPTMVLELQQEFTGRSFEAACVVRQLQLFRHSGWEWKPVGDFELGAPKTRLDETP